MADGVALIYLEADDEITSVVRRVRASSEARVVVVAPGRARATSSAVALRLLARVAADDGREVGVVGDALTRSLAAEAGLPAYLSVEDARASVSVDPVESQPRRAGIHVVRGAEDTDTAPTMTSAPALGPDATSAETRALPRAEHASTPTRARGRSSRRRWRSAVGAAVVLLLLFTSVASAFVLLPSATVTLEPRRARIGPQEYSIVVTDFEGRRGEVRAETTVTPTGTYEEREAARGFVTLYNFSGDPVPVAAGSFVAAGVQAFATDAPITVPEGGLTPGGAVEAGEATVAVTAAEPGPAGNVGVEEINTVLSAALSARLKAYDDNPRPVVLNAEPTTGGAAETGDEITQGDVDRAVRDLEAGLALAVDDEVGASDAVLVPSDAAVEPVIEGLEDLVGMRDVADATITGTLSYDVRVVDVSAIEPVARDRLQSDPDALDAGYSLDPASVRIEPIDASAAGDNAVTVRVRATADAVRHVDPDDVVARVRGLEVADAEAALADVAERVEITPWPGWFASVPSFEWRIEVRIDGPASAAAAGASPPESSP